MEIENGTFSHRLTHNRRFYSDHFICAQKKTPSCLVAMDFDRSRIYIWDLCPGGHREFPGRRSEQSRISHRSFPRIYRFRVGCPPGAFCLYWQIQVKKKSHTLKKMERMDV